jgi:hypothetical protein
VHAAAVCAGAGRGSMNARSASTPACLPLCGKRESQRPRAHDTRMRAELARAAQQLAVPIEFVSVLDERRSEHVPRCAPGGHDHNAPVPCVAGVAGMSVRHPPADVVRQTDVAVVAAGARRSGRRSPYSPIVRTCVGPARVIARCGIAIGPS